MQSEPNGCLPTLRPTPVDKRIEEPERRVAPGREQSPVFLFPGVREAVDRLLPRADTLECQLPPSCPRAVPADDLSGPIVADVFQTATLEERRELASEPGIITARCPPFPIPVCAVIAGVVRM